VKNAKKNMLKFGLTVFLTLIVSTVEVAGQ